MLFSAANRPWIGLLGAILLIMAVETLIFLKFSPASSSMETETAALLPEQAQKKLRERENLFLIDVRSRREFAARHYENAINMPLLALQKRIDEIPRYCPVLVYSNYGHRAQRAYKMIRCLRPDIADIHYVEGSLFPLPLNPQP